MGINNIDFQQIEDFVSGKMSPEQASQFQDLVQNDPLLHNEVQLQNDIVNQIKNERKAELKARLNNVPVNSGFQLKFVHLAATVIVAGVVTTALVLLNKKPTEETFTPTTTVVEKKNTTPTLTTNTTSTDAVTQENNVEEKVNDNTTAKSTATVTIDESSKKVINETPSYVETPSIDILEKDDNLKHNIDKSKAPEHASAKNIVRSDASIAESINYERNKKKWKYTFKDKKLTLWFDDSKYYNLHIYSHKADFEIDGKKYVLLNNKVNEPIK